MVQKNYFSLNDTQNVLALLLKGYSFIEIGSSVNADQCIDENDQEHMFIEAIPRTEQLTDKEYLLLSQFLKNAPQPGYGVESSYFHN